MPKKETTIDDLAVMVQKGFVEVEKNMARKDEMRKGFDEVNHRLMKIERKIESNHEQRIERLEDDVKWLRSQLTLGETG
ncbi:MAG: hypothetical protein M1127_03255 [Patescibacteria group bacterium]|nr:hypothetical protein [Patescibacteria group bacterium]